MKKLNINQIMNLLPHTYPFLLIDSVEDYNEGKIVCKKNVTINEPFFQGHFPSQPIMPGVFLVECGAQAAALMYILDSFLGEGLHEDELTQTLSDPLLSDKVGYLASIKNFKFKGLVIPGDTLNIKCERMISFGKLSEIKINISNEVRKEIACGRVLVSQK